MLDRMALEKEKTAGRLETIIMAEGDIVSPDLRFNVGADVGINVGADLKKRISIIFLTVWSSLNDLISRTSAFIR